MAEKEAKKRVTFKFSDAVARQVFLAGSFNAWDPSARPLKKDAKGVWKTTMMLSQGVYQYRFIVDGNWMEDPVSHEKQINEFGSYNSVVIV